MSLGCLRAFSLFIVCFFSSVTFGDMVVQSSACFPQTTAAKKWPVAVIYMHGLFEPGGEASTVFRGMELANRLLLESLAQEKHIRIAVPLAPAQGKWRTWNGLSLGQIETLAKSACGNAKLLDGRDLVAFSNGAINSQKFTCQATEEYSHVFSIGAHPYETSSGTKRCDGVHRFQASPAHDFEAGIKKFKNLLTIRF
jgi:hypothetical protein